MRQLLFRLLFGCSFAGFGIAMAVMLVWEVWWWAETGRWTIVPATIEAVRLENSDDAMRVHCSYTYAFDGRRYTGDRVSLSAIADNIGSYHRDLYERIEAARSRGRTYDVHVDPDDPRRAILDRTFRPGMMVFEMVFIVVFGSSGLTVVTYALMTRKPRRLADGRIRIDSAHRVSRACALVLLTFHGLVSLIVVPMSVITILAGQWPGWIAAAASAVPLLIVRYSFRGRFGKHRWIGTLLLPADTSGDATLTLPIGRDEPVELEVRAVVPAPPSNRVGVEDTPGEVEWIQRSSAPADGRGCLIDVPIPELPRLPAGQSDPPTWRLELIGTIGDQKYEDAFEIPIS